MSNTFGDHSTGQPSGKIEVDQLEDIHKLEEINEFLVVERMFSVDVANPSFGLANISPRTHDLEGNKSKVERAAKIFKDRRVNIAVFPEFSLSGYFWDDYEDCKAYMDTTVLEEHYDWIESSLKPLLDENLREIILNSLTRGPDGKFYNTTTVIGEGNDYSNPENSYHKVFLPGIEKKYTVSGQDNRLVVDGPFGRFGFSTCYDYLFSELLREYAFEDHVDAIIQTAAWRAVARRDYPSMNVRTDQYYGDLWNMVMPASSATHQIWTIACNSVGNHDISGATFWGGSGIWAPSGLKLVQGSHLHEELLIVHNVDIKNQRRQEKDDFDYAFDFLQIYRRMEGVATVSAIK
jgi:predicted amidohydrolase